MKPDPIDKALNKRNDFLKHKHRLPCTGYAVFGVWVVVFVLIYYKWFFFVLMSYELTGREEIAKNFTSSLKSIK